MHSGKHNRSERRRHALSALGRDLELTAEQRLRRGRPHAHERLRLHDRELVVYARAVRVDLALVRTLVDPPLAARLPFEVLDDVGDVDGFAIDARFFERAIEQFAGRTDERMALQVFVVARLLADEHQFRALRSFSKYGLPRVLPQIAVAARLCRATHLRERAGGHLTCTTSAIMPRPLWKGAISFGLVSIPVELHTAVRDTRPHFRMLHAKDKSPFRFERACIQAGQPVAWQDLVKGYEIEKGHFVVITKDDFKAAALEKTQTVDILDFVKVEEIDDR